jgi:hypothetical protein
MDGGDVGVDGAAEGRVGVIGFAALGSFGLHADSSGASKEAAPTVPQIKNCLLDILLAIISTSKIRIVDYYQNTGYLRLINGQSAEKRITIRIHPIPIQYKPIIRGML